MKKYLSSFTPHLSPLKGFTLIELVVSIGILATFSAALMATINPFEQFKKSSDGQRKTDLAQVQRGLEAYYQDYGRYPESSSSKIAPGGSVKDWGSSWSPYLEILPKDPNKSKSYVYLLPTSDGQSYQLYASLDREGKDPQACKTDGTACDGAVGVSCGTGKTCNYGVSSPNVSP